MSQGIVSLLPTTHRFNEAETKELDSERRQRDREAQLYDRIAALRFLSLLEIPATLGPLKVNRNDRIVEVGCGTGRMTIPIARTGAHIVAVDHSLASLQVLRGKLEVIPNHCVLVVQADATALPIVSNWATAGVSCQVIEHLPTQRLRQGLVSELARVVIPGGRLALSGYRYWPALQGLLPQDGHHSGAIYFHRFAPDELLRLLEPEIEVDRLSSRLIYLLLAHGRRRKVPEC